MQLNLYLVKIVGTVLVIACHQKSDMLRMICDEKHRISPGIKLCDVVKSIRESRKIGNTNQYIRPIIIG